MELKNKNLFWIILLLVILNIIIRIPTMQNEPGSDTFVIHSMANSITSNGGAGWIQHPLSFFGMYPGSYASAVPFLLSGINLVSNIKMDKVILITSIIIGLIGFFTVFILARKIKDNLFAILVAFAFSLSPVFLLYTIWSASTRHLFMAILPLFIYCFLCILDRPHKIKYLILFIIFLLLLGTTHRLFFLVPLIIIAFISSLILSNIKLSFEIYGKKINIIFFIWFAFLSIWIVAQSYHVGIYENINFADKYESGIVFSGKGGETILKNFVIDYGSKIGLLSIFFIIGIITLLIKRGKNFNDILLLTTILIFSPILLYGTYVPLFLLIFFCLLIGIGLETIFLKIPILSIFRKYAFINRINKFKNYLLPLILFASISFSIFMLVHWNIILIKSPEISNSAQEMNIALFFNEFTSKGIYDTNNPYISPNIQAFSKLETISRKIELSENKSFIVRQPFNKWFPNFENIYVVEKPFSREIDVYTNLYPVRYDNTLAQQIINKTDLKYIVLFKNIPNTDFFDSIKNEKSIIYNDGSEGIAYLQ